jgi:hypothetical protein
VVKAFNAFLAPLFDRHQGRGLLLLYDAPRTANLARQGPLHVPLAKCVAQTPLPPRRNREHGEEMATLTAVPQAHLIAGSNGSLE